LEYIKIRGAREHNLKNINVDIPRNKITVITGLSGSGKSSLAFDTIYAEGQRRYMESLSSYARQFVENIDKPDFDSIEGLSPAISVDQKTFLRNPRSTVGTITEIYDYLRVLFARVGKARCFKCDSEITVQDTDEMVQSALRLKSKSIVYIFSPIVRGRKGEYRKDLDDLRTEGFIKVRIDGKLHELDDEININKQKMHDIEILIDAVDINSDDSAINLKTALEESVRRSGGVVILESDTGETLILSKQHSCPRCGASYPEISPRLFSFNSPYGACTECSGLGSKTYFDPELIIESRDKSISDGTIIPWKNSRYFSDIMQSVADSYSFSLTTPLNELPDNIVDELLFGSGGKKIRFRRVKNGRIDQYSDTFPGIVGMLANWYEETSSLSVKNNLSKYITTTKCDECGGARLKKESLSVTIGSKNIFDIISMPAARSRSFFEKLQLNKRDREIGNRVIYEIVERLSFLTSVGLEYLSLERSAPTLSGGEAQRIRLASQVGSNLRGITYVLDEPTIGLHHKDNRLLIDTLKKLREKGNTIIVVEHDEDTIHNSDHIVDIGSGAGELGGNVVYSGNIENLKTSSESITGKFLTGEMSIKVPDRRRRPSGSIIIRGAREHNLKIKEVAIPLGVFLCVTGVSGSGKSTLINDILYKSLSRKLYKSTAVPGECEEIAGTENINQLINVDQTPIGRTPRSNLITYTGLFTTIRELFSMLPESRLRGYNPGRFSFNVSGGRCEKCGGDGLIKIDMHFLPDVYVKCDYCKGRRYNQEILYIKYRNKNISDVLDMTVSEAAEFFKNVPRLKKGFDLISQVGLEYIRLGQPATTLSGGEAQRIKLSKELLRRSTKTTLYILDEPTIGLHFQDVKKLLNIIQDLVDMGNTVIVIEHNMEMIKCSDFVIDLGPEGGEKGGRIIASGTPEEICRVKGSYTGYYLEKILNTNKH